MTRYVRNMQRSTASRSPSQTPSGSPTTRPTDGTAAALSYRSASPSTQRHPTTRQCPSESRPPAMTQRVSSTSTPARSRRQSPTTTPTPSAAAVTVISPGEPLLPSPQAVVPPPHISPTSPKTNSAQHVRQLDSRM